MNDKIDNNNLGAMSGETKTNHEGDNAIKKSGHATTNVKQGQL